MASQEAFVALLQADQHGWERQTQGSHAKLRPPQSHRSGEQAPLPPMPQAAPQLASKSRPKRHGRSKSDFIGAPLDPGQPYSKNARSPPTGIVGNRSSRPPRAGAQPSMAPPPPPMPIPFVHPMYATSPQGSGGPPRKSLSRHQRAKSDIPLALFGVAGNIPRGGQFITKTDLLKSLPSPRWGNHNSNRSRAGSDGFLSENASISSGGPNSGGYGAISSSFRGTLSSSGKFDEGNPLLQSIGSVQIPTGPGQGRRHRSLMSNSSIMSVDTSAVSVTIDMAKSALFKGVTDTGRIRLQLPKDSFRILMDSQLETGHVYRRKLVDDADEESFYVEFHTVDDIDSASDSGKRLPPDLYVMAVDSTIYRRMLDEVIASKSMPCGTFFCGHHEDVRHPDITIAAIIVGMLFMFLTAAVIWLPGDD